MVRLEPSPVFNIAAASPSRLALMGASPLVPDEAGKIVGEIDHSDPGAGPSDADGTHEQSHPGFLLREDVLDEGADL